jgi:DNA-dependent RNA polymerase auxiliary subunit epsilon
MSRDGFIEDFKANLVALQEARGVNPKALFQTRSRQLRFPGRSIFLTYAKTYVDAKIDTNTRSSVDDEGNFNISQTFIGRIRNKFAEYNALFSEDRTAVKYNPHSFVNRRLAVGVFNASRTAAASARRD